jgi:hypothetical protein
MTKARNIANIASDGSALADGTINYTDVSGTPTLATVATSGAYADVTGTPTLAAVATSGSFNDLSNQPSPFDPNTLATVATTGAYADVTGTPTLATVATTGAYGDLSGTPAAALPLAGGTLTGNVNLGDNVKANFGAGSDLQIYHDGSHSFIHDVGVGNLDIRTNGNRVYIGKTDGENSARFDTDGAVYLYDNNALKLATTATGISVTGNATFADNDKAIFGAGSDLQIYHNGSTSVIEDSGTGALQIKATDLEIRSYTTNENYIYCVENGAVTLYYNDAAKIATTATGISVTGDVDTSGTILVGGTNSVFAENNLKFNSGGASYIDHSTVGQAINFRVSNASSLDTNAMTISSTGVISGNGSGLTGVSPPTTFGAVGTYTWGRTQDDTSNLLPGNTTASLYAAGQRATYPVVFFRSGTWDNGATTGAVSGTWRCMSPAYSDAGRGYLGLFVRIA